MGSFRKARVADAILGCLAEKIRRLTDPRLKFVTVTAVHLAADLKSSRVYWTALASDLATGEARVGEYPQKSERRDISEALGHASGLLRKELGQELGLRYTPQLRFEYDESIEYGSRIDSLLERVSDSKSKTE